MGLREFFKNRRLTLEIYDFDFRDLLDEVFLTAEKHFSKKKNQIVKSYFGVPNNITEGLKINIY